MQAPTIKVDGDKLLVTMALSTGIDNDKDGVYAAKVTGGIELELKGLEVVDELMKSSALVDQIKAKLGL